MKRLFSAASALAVLMGPITTANAQGRPVPEEGTFESLGECMAAMGYYRSQNREENANIEYYCFEIEDGVWILTATISK